MEFYSKFIWGVGSNLFFKVVLVRKVVFRGRDFISVYLIFDRVRDEGVILVFEDGLENNGVSD